MFRAGPTTTLQVDEYINELQEDLSLDAQTKMLLLVSIKNFLADTHPGNQHERDQGLNDKVRLRILSEVAGALSQFRPEFCTDKESAVALQDFCKRVIQERLDFMRDNKDKIYQFYISYPNPLTALLSSAATPRLI